MSKPIIKFHLGAHKTGTTHLQKTLRWNREEFSENHIHVIDDQFKRVRFYLSGERDISREECRAPFLAAAEAGAEIIIFSDEDALMPSTISDRVSIYNNINSVIENAASIAHNIGRIEILFSIREYSSFIFSVYQQEVKRGRTKLSFTDYVFRKVDFDNISWLNVVTEIVTGFDGRAAIWDHSFFSNNPLSIMQEFGIYEENLKNIKYPQERSNVSLSAPGLEVLLAANGALGKKEWRDLENFVVANLSTKNTNLPKPIGWNLDDASILKKRYIGELEKIKSIIERNGGVFLGAEQ